jgi:membrane protein implicated in regulation of membrane protease activity
MTTTDAVLPASFVRAAARIHAAELAGRLGHCQTFGGSYLLIIALMILCWLAADRGAFVVFPLLVAILVLLVVRTMFRYRKWQTVQRIDNPQMQEIVVAKAYKIMRNHNNHGNETNDDRATTLGLRFDDDDGSTRRKEEEQEDVFVSNISADSPFQNTLLRIGMKIVSINGEIPKD